MAQATLPPASSTTILITGVNGYIASHIGLLLLQQGYSVRGTSRSASTEATLRSGPYAAYSSTYTHHTVPSLLTPGAFDAAVVGVASIIHVASPVDFTLQTLDAYLQPAMQGVQNILKSATAHAGPQLRSFILTSSVTAIADRWLHPFADCYSYSEADWNVNSERVARETFSAPVAYGASKTVAERAMWEFASRPPANFQCVAINPGVVIGPPLVGLVSEPEKLNTTLLPVWALYSGLAKREGKMPPPIGSATWVDVRDVAALHAWAATNPLEAAGMDVDGSGKGKGRFLATRGVAPPQAVADLLRKELGEGDRGRILVGEPAKGYYGDVEVCGWPAEGEGQRARAVKMEMVFESIGWAAKGLKESVMDTIRAFEEVWPGRAAREWERKSSEAARTE
jgi:nucleoside-diphosphate-sugar epimerase